MYESKGKKIAKEAEANKGLPAGLTREDWEKMKEAQANLLNDRQPKAAKKKNNKKKTPTTDQTTAGDNQNDNQLNDPEQPQITTLPTAAKKKKNKNKQTSNNENNSTTATINKQPSPTNQASSPVSDDWVTMGKPKKSSSTTTTANLDKATSAVKSLSLVNKKSKEKSSKKRVVELPVSKGVDELASDMLVDDDHDEVNEELNKIEKNNEKQLLVKKIKTLKRKLKEVDTLKELQKTKTLDSEQKEKVNKFEQFTKELTKVQSKLEQLNSSK